MPWVTPRLSHWKELLKRVLEARTEINLKGGSAKNWGGNLAEVKKMLGCLRDLGRDFEHLPNGMTTTVWPLRSWLL